MATLIKLADGDDGPLRRLDPGLEANEQEYRQIYTSTNLEKWLSDKLPNLKAQWKTELSPAEQFYGLIDTFCSGVVMVYRKQFSPLTPHQDSVWEMKTDDVRIFGWFPVKDCFVGVVANDAGFIKEHDLYQGYIGEVLRYRNGLDLDEPKFVVGGDPNDVVSNFSYPQ